jgi:uncharacterized protein YdhG (YjbR/CyaY superfamily)
MAMMKSTSSIDEYINKQPVKTQKILNKVRAIVNKIIPDAEEAMRYGIPTFRLKENLVHFAAYEHHIGFYPSPLVIAAFSKDIKGYTSSKGAIQFPLDEPIPYELIKAMTKFRIEQLKQPKSKPKSKKK